MQPAKSLNNNNNERYLVRVTLNSKADKPVALICGSNWNLVLVFVEGGKPENPEKNPRSRAIINKKTQPTCGAGSVNRTRATVVGGECSHHCAIPAPLNNKLERFLSPRNSKKAKKDNEIYIERSRSLHEL